MAAQINRRALTTGILAATATPARLDGPKREHAQTFGTVLGA